MGKPPTIRDVAARAGVSVATASNVVNGNRPVGEESRRRVLEAVADLGYRVDRAASALRGASTRLVGMVVPDVTNVFFASLVQAVEALAERDGYDLLLASTSEDAAIEKRRIDALIGRRLDGLIAVPASDVSMAALGAHGLRLPPTVLLDRGADSPEFDTVRADCETGGYEAVRHLIGLGHRDIAVLTHSQHLRNLAERIAGCRRALAEAGLDGRERLVFGGHDLENLRSAIETELSRPAPPTAIFALTNVCALAALKAARDLGLEIPDDVSIVGFDDFDWMLALRPYLTTVAQPVDGFAASAWTLLTRRMGGDAATPPERVLLACALKVRESTGPVRAKLKAAAKAH
ncbi:LacI family transcriptional regulator [Roseiarcus fermentans]|uniref:LacI family transcriptional regulator n=1 Tax=Roseiarcus fermentans TaxID=1473586 RepID=A0A366FNE7_9HYPH|nr:LacI family DNA-binding transcriptional regulator [Roseiarcus fermentans]RBP15570.1 LacI family transcriptional regulator [Roseiarcus fermentans]